MKTKEQIYGVKAIELISSFIKDGVKDDKKKELKEVFTLLVELPLLFHTQGSILAYREVIAHKKKNVILPLFIGTDFGISNEVNGNFIEIANKLNEFSLQENDIYRGNCIRMAEELKSAAQILIKPLI